jgi:hypothetical protein
MGMTGTGNSSLNRGALTPRNIWESRVFVLMFQQKCYARSVWHAQYLVGTRRQSLVIVW